jgi:hypothetical protein
MSEPNATTVAAMLEARGMHTVSDLEGFQPGSYGCHEALHVTSLILSMIHEHLSTHPAIMLKPKWRRLVSEAEDILAELYQEIGSVHL